MIEALVNFHERDYFLKLIEVQLAYNVILISGAQLGDLTILDIFQCSPGQV